MGPAISYLGYRWVFAYDSLLCQLSGVVTEDGPVARVEIIPGGRELFPRKGFCSFTEIRLEVTSVQAAALTSSPQSSEGPATLLQYPRDHCSLALVRSSVIHKPLNSPIKLALITNSPS